LELVFLSHTILFLNPKKLPILKNINTYLTNAY
jgi:hypothetical protein